MDERKIAKEATTSLRPECFCLGAGEALCSRVDFRRSGSGLAHGVRGRYDDRGLLEVAV